MNKTTQKVVSTIGVMLGIAGFNHGFFEALQGWKPTGGLIIRAIAEDQFRYIQGSEEAFTIIPNFLITGLAAMLVSTAIIVWSLRYLDRPRGASVFLGLFILLFLVGGGIGQVVFFLPTWGAATRINRPLNWWNKILGVRLRRGLTHFWRYTQPAAVVFFLIALVIAIIWQLPGITDPEVILQIDWSFLLAGWVLMLVSFGSAFAADLEARRPAGDPQ
jgi:uncharacterized membrane protein YjjP (DUF1212 family)